MDILESLYLALDAIKVNKARSVLTALGVIIGVASIILLLSISNGLQSYVQGQFEKIGSNSVFVIPGKFEFAAGGGPPRVVNKLTLDLADSIYKEKGSAIEDVLPMLEIGATARHGSKTEITTLVGTKSSYFKIGDIKTQSGRLFTDRDDNGGRRVAVVGTTIAKNLYGTEEVLGKKISLSKQNFTVIGVMAVQGNVAGVDIDNQVIIPIKSARRLTGSDQINSIMVRSTSAETIDEAKARIEKILLRTLSEDDFSILTQEQLLASILQILGVLTAALGGIAAISLVVGGVGISNIMLVSVTERTREIGLRKAVGAKPRDILTQFLFEAVILSLAGGCIGLVLGFLGSLVVSQFLQASVPLWAVFLGIGFSSSVGIVFGVVPAVRASRLDPIVALRHE